MGKIGFNCIAGYKSEVKELSNLCKLLKKSEEFLGKGFRLPRGLLLAGDPGVGKTIMAESLINESNMNCIRIEIENVDDDELSKYLDEKFKEASSNAPSIIFIDELDKICGEVNPFGMSYDVDICRKIIKAINDNPNDGVMLLATANDKDMLNSALMRSGRFDKIINIPVPSYEDRKEIIHYYASGKKFDKKVNFDTLAKITGSFTGADIECIINEAGINATIEDREEITYNDLSKAVNGIVFQGCEKDHLLSKENKENVAIHETGHLLAGLLLNKDCVGGVTIISQGEAKGHMKVFRDEYNVCKKQELIDNIVIALAGRAAEKVFKPEEDFLGGESDISKAYFYAKRLVGDSCFYGFEYYANTIQRGNAFGQGPLSQERLVRIEKKSDEIVQECLDRAIELIRNNKELAEIYVSELKKKFSLTREEIMRIYNKYNKTKKQ